jgi:hypothetical protein
MNTTIFTEIDSRAISHLKSEIKHNKILIRILSKQNELICTTWDKMNENFSKIMDYKKNIQELEKKH